MRYHPEIIIGLILVLGFIDGLLWYHFRKGQKKKGIYQWLAVLFFLVVPILSLSGFGYFARNIPQAQSAEIYTSFNTFLVIFTLIYTPKLVYLAVYGFGKVLKIGDTATPRNVRARHYPALTRRKFLSQIGIITATMPFVTLLFGVLKGRFAFYTRKVKLQFPNLPGAFDGLRIVQISDLHLGSFGSNREPLTRAMEMVNDQKPDMILFTGDLVNNFAGETTGWEEIFKTLKAPLGIYSILGNHDYGDYSSWSSEARKEANFRGIVNANHRFGFKLLRNESVMIEKEGEQLAISGVENWGHPPFPQYGDLEKAWQGAEGKPFKILMTHDPDHWGAEVMGQKDYDLTLSGHTHGMQFGVQLGSYHWSPAKYKFKRWAGLYRETNQFLYVNCGLGYLGIPARVGMPPEITVFELRRGELRAS